MTLSQLVVTRVTSNVESECEQVLRSLPRWFGREETLVKYAQDTSRLPTFVICGDEAVTVKTIAAAVQSPEYAETRDFNKSMGFVPLEVFPTLWSEVHPCLQLIKGIAESK